MHHAGSLPPSSPCNRALPNNACERPSSPFLLRCENFSTSALPAVHGNRGTATEGAQCARELWHCHAFAARGAADARERWHCHSFAAKRMKHVALPHIPRFPRENGGTATLFTQSERKTWQCHICAAKNVLNVLREKRVKKGHLAERWGFEPQIGVMLPILA